MNTLYFKYAAEIERAGSITQAAENLYMAQPNLSKAIRELEVGLGFPVFDRTPKGVQPTQKGVGFLTHARNILEQLEKINSLSDAGSDGSRTFGASIPRSAYIAEGFSKFAAELDFDCGLQMDVQETNSMQAIENVVGGRHNLGIIRFRTSHESYFTDYLAEKQLFHEQIWEFELFVLFSRKHPLAGAESFTFKDLEPFVEVALGDDSVPYLASSQWSRSRAEGGKRISVYERCSLFDLLGSVSGAYMWVSPIPQRILDLHGFAQRRCPFPSNTCKDALIRRKGYCFSELDKRFIDSLYRSKNDVSLRAYI